MTFKKWFDRCCPLTEDRHVKAAWNAAQEQQAETIKELREALLEAANWFESDFDDIDDYLLGDLSDKYRAIARKGE